jgi:hypothetical protein
MMSIAQVHNLLKYAPSSEILNCILRGCLPKTFSDTNEPHGPCRVSVTEEAHQSLYMFMRQIEMKIHSGLL